MSTLLAALYCSASIEAIYAYGKPVAIPVSDDPKAPLPRTIVWVPAGTHDIYAHGADMQPVQARIVCDEQSARSIIAHFDELRAKGGRIWLDKNHEDAEATGDVRSFSWDSTRGIVATVDWTPYGERLLRDKVFCSFSPAFLRNKTTGRPTKLMDGKSAGGLVNAPAFGAAMPALIAARFAGAEPSHANPAPAGPAGNPQSKLMNKDQNIALLASLGVKVPDNATDEQISALNAQHLSPEAIKAKLAPTAAVATEATGSANEVIQAKLAELDTLKAAAATRRKADAKQAVDAAVARGALPPKDEAIQAKWAGLIESNPENAALLAAMPGNPALATITKPGAHVEAHDGAVEVLRAMAATPLGDVAKRSQIYGRDIAPLFAKSGFELGPILASNSLGTLSGELITQRSLSLLKRQYPALTAFSTDFSSENAAFGQTIKARIQSIPTITDYSTATGYSTSGATSTDVDLIISGHKAVQISFNANELASTGRDLFGEQAEGAHASIAADLFDTAVGVITPANFSYETAVALNSFTRKSLSGISQALTARHVARMRRFALLNLDYYAQLGEDSSIVSLAAYQKPEVITDGELPRLAKLQPYEVEDFPTTSNLVGFAGAPDALVLATRVPSDYTKLMPDVSSNGVVQYVRNPDLGITVMLVRFIDHQAGTATWRLAYMRGAAKGNARSGQRIVSAATSS